jgi:hypothetical protein
MIGKPMPSFWAMSHMFSITQPKISIPSTSPSDAGARFLWSLGHDENGRAHFDRLIQCPREYGLLSRRRAVYGPAMPSGTPARGSRPFFGAALLLIFDNCSNFSLIKSGDGYVVMFPS